MTQTFSQTNFRRACREQARLHLLPFTTYTKPDYVTNWHHMELARKLDEVAAGRCQRLMIFMPPQHGKSELVSRRFPAYMLGQNPDLRLICATHTADLAVSMNRDVQRIMAGEAYGQVFPKTRTGDKPGRTSAAPLARRTMDLFEIPGRRGFLRSAGVGNAIAGNAADGAIIDDPFGKREDAESPVMRQRIWEWYTSDLFTRLSAKAWIVLTHTRWHRDDLAGRLLRKMAASGGDRWDVLCLPAVREECPADPSDHRQPGEPLWPSFKSAGDLDIIREQDPRAYAALYQQNPADASSAEWRPELFDDSIWVPPEKWPKSFKMPLVCVDPSKGGSDKQGDYCAMVFMGMGSDNLLYVDAVIERIPLDQIVRKLLELCRQWRPQHVGIEADQFQELLVHEFRRQCGDSMRLPVPMGLWKMRTQGVNKIARIRRLSQYVINRELRFKADSPGCRLLVEQLMDFPFAEHDDGPDALEMCMRLPFAVHEDEEEKRMDARLAKMQRMATSGFWNRGYRPTPHNSIYQAPQQPMHEYWDEDAG
jgi:predicted phage terminase large subunit-like protein